MNIRIPLVLVRAWEAFHDWGNVPVTSRFDLRRLDLVMGVLCALTIAWYGYWYGWMGALQGGVAFAATAALALFVRRAG